MQDSYPFTVYSGVLDPTHYKQINNAMWLFLWCVSCTTKDVERDGVVWGLVLGNKPVQIQELADRFGVSRSTVKRWVETLEQHEYIKTTRAPYGLIFTVKNSKKFMFKNEPSDNSDSSNMNHLNASDSSNVVHLVSRNEPSNKDITVDNVVIITDPEEIMKRSSQVEKHFIQRRGKGIFISPSDFDEIKKLVATGIPLEIVFTAIDKSFEEYKPKFYRDEIRNVSYCIPRCYSEWERSKVDKSCITGAVPHAPVALAAGHKSKQQQAFDILDQIAKE